MFHQWFLQSDVAGWLHRLHDPQSGTAPTILSLSGRGRWRRQENLVFIPDGGSTSIVIIAATPRWQTRETFAISLRTPLVRGESCEEKVRAPNEAGRVMFQVHLVALQPQSHKQGCVAKRDNKVKIWRRGWDSISTELLSLVPSRI